MKKYWPLLVLLLIFLSGLAIFKVRLYQQRDHLPRVKHQALAPAVTDQLNNQKPVGPDTPLINETKKEIQASKPPATTAAEVVESKTPSNVQSVDGKQVKPPIVDAIKESSNEPNKAMALTSSAIGTKSTTLEFKLSVRLKKWLANGATFNEALGAENSWTYLKAVLPELAQEFNKDPDHFPLPDGSKLALQNCKAKAQSLKDLQYEVAFNGGGQKIKVCSAQKLPPGPNCAHVLSKITGWNDEVVFNGKECEPTHKAKQALAGQHQASKTALLPDSVYQKNSQLWNQAVQQAFPFMGAQGLLGLKNL